MEADILAGKRVVVVEDEGITLMHMERIFRMCGVQLVDMATNGPEGVALVLRQHPDLVLMDINMPGEYDGLEATRRILASLNTCVILLTAYTDYCDQARQAGAYGYIQKPLDRHTLLTEVRHILACYAAGEPPAFGEGPR